MVTRSPEGAEGRVPSTGVARITIGARGDSKQRFSPYSQGEMEVKREAGRWAQGRPERGEEGARGQGDIADTPEVLLGPSWSRDRHKRESRADLDQEKLTLTRRRS